MWYVAFTLGLFGSLHCVGMCGPLAIAFCNRGDNSITQNIFSALSYNLGRTTTYAILGLLFGSAGSFIVFADLQKGLSMILGSVLVASFLLSIDIDRSINNNSVVQRIFGNVRRLIARMMQRSQDYHPYSLGMVNGLLPCGLIYLALAGALATGHTLGGMLFMALFGLGTLPMLFALSTGMGLFSSTIRMQFRTVLPYVSLGFGVFLIYRGVVVDIPTQLNFWEALKNPVMCH